MKKFFIENLKNTWFWLFVALSIVLLLAMPLMSRQAGNTGDEDGFQIPQGKNVVNYFKTDGADTTCLNFKNLMYYGSSFDVMAEYVNGKFNVDDISSSRHVFNSLFGWLAILMVGLIAYQLGGPRAGVMAILLIFLSPRFLGHSFNNPKDIPFAAGVISAIYGMVLFFKQFPKVKWYTYVILILSIALAISTRIGGLILFGYFGLFGLTFTIKMWKEGRQNNKLPNKKIADNDRFVPKFLKMVATAILICVVGYFLGLLLWPYAMQSPIKHSIESFKAMSSFATSIRQVFEGTMQWSDYLPWYYTPKYILMTIPVAVIIGLVLFFVFCWRKKEDRFWAFLVFFTFFFPVFWIVYTNANVYGGWRHAMFAYPPMAVAAGLGFEGLVKWVEAKVQGSKFKVQSSNKEEQLAEVGSKKPLVVNICAVAFLLLLLIGPIRHILANHPYEYVYFNELVGGTKNQLGQYELDYYYHSTREASEWVIANAEKKADGSKTIVATWHTASVDYFFRKDTSDFKVRFVRWYEKENSDWDYAIFTVTGMAPSYLKSNNFPPKNTVKTIDVDGVPIAIILKREDKSDCQAFAMKQDPSKLDSVVMLYQKALQKDPDNLGALLNIGETYVRMSKPDSALIYLNHYYEIDAESEMANYMRAYAYVYKNDANTALDVLHKIQKHNPKYVASYILAVQLHLQKKDYVAAKKEFLKAIDVDQMNDQLTQLWIQYCAMQNIDQNNAYIQLYKLMAKSCEKRGKKEEAERYLKAIGR